MANDAKTVLQKYVSDMVSLEDHIYQAIDKQVKEVSDQPELSTKLQGFAQTAQRHSQQLQSRLGQMGGAANQPVKQGVAAVAGVAAGVIDKLRSDEESKDIRDDITAFNLSLTAYAMLYTTALALKDQETAQIAADFAKENADSIMYLHQNLPSIVIRNLKDNYNVAVDPTVTDQTRQLISSIWRS